jgi:GTP cyclohydrolase I
MRETNHTRPMNDSNNSLGTWKAMVHDHSTWKAMEIRNKFERWNDNFVDIKDMKSEELCEYYLSTKEIINNQTK